MIGLKTEQVVVGELFASFEKVVLHGKGEGDYVSPKSTHELFGCLHRPARCEQVVHQDSVLTRLDGAQVIFEPIRPIFEIIGNAVRRARKLPRLSNGDDTGV